MIKPLIPEGANRAVYTTPELIGPREPRKRTTGGPRSETEQCRRSLLCANRTGRAPNKMRRRSRRSISFYCGIVPPSWRGPTVRPIRWSRSRSRVASRQLTRARARADLWSREFADKLRADSCNILSSDRTNSLVRETDRAAFECIVDDYVFDTWDRWVDENNRSSFLIIGQVLIESR